MGDKAKDTPYKTVTFSKDNPVVEVSSKQSQVGTQNIIPPVMPKDSKKD